MTKNASHPSDDAELLDAIETAHAELDPAAQAAQVKKTPKSVRPEQLRQAWEKVARMQSDRERQLKGIARERTEIALERSEAERRHADAVAKERELQERELNAEHGFREQNENGLRELEKTAGNLRRRLRKLRSEATEARSSAEAELARQREERLAALEVELEQLRAEALTELNEKRAALDVEHDELRLIGDESRRQRREIEAEKAVLEDDRAATVQKAERQHAARLEELEAANETMQGRLDQSRQDRREAEVELDAVRASIRVLDGRPLDAIAEDLRSLRVERDQLQEELARRPDADQSAAIEEQRLANEALKDELAEIRRERNELQIARDRERSHLAEVEVLRDQVRALESTRQAYRQAIEEQKQNFDDLVALQATRSPFELMTKMDGDPALQERPARVVRPTALKGLIDELRHRIAAEPLHAGQPLYFSLRDLRVFVAGLAMSRLHLLQGISGTGKTSLPLAFAKAIGGGSDVVEVQAGWRDRQDLLGHYNTFERRYDETMFVQALYRAQTEAYSDRPYLVVLDEMNLSHPEQYFADLLSALERGEPRLSLTNTGLEPSPARLEGGRILSIPDNVWFIGTANHDETTMGFADKTYDRAHVQELPSRREEFAPQKVATGGSVSFEALLSLFDQAAERRSEDADLAVEYLESELGQILEDRFNVGWGNRLEKQLRRFVPVVVEGGGSIDEAVDHVVATKILRKVRDRHDISLDDIETLDQQLASSWGVLGSSGSEPTISRRILEHEKRRLSGGLG